MDEGYYMALAKVRMDRAEELLIEAKDLLEKSSYKSANNRAFYAIEKSIKALLAMKQIEATTHKVEVATHNGGLNSSIISLFLKEMEYLLLRITRKLSMQTKFVMHQIMMIFI